MGFEALSRGAAAVTMIEKSVPAFKALMSNKQALQAEQALLLNQDAMQFLATNEQKFSLIFLDPPYTQQWLSKLLPILSQHLHADGLVYAEAEYAIDSKSEFAADWQVLKQGKAGNVFYHLLKSQHGTSIP